jgi:hypothetical protein
MDFFSELGKTLDTVINQVGEKTEEIWEVGKTNLEIVKNEDAIRRMYRKIGELVSSEFNKGMTFSDEINQACAEVEKRKKLVEELKSKLGKSKSSGRYSTNTSEEASDGTEEAPNITIIPLDSSDGSSIKLDDID